MFKIILYLVICVLFVVGGLLNEYREVYIDNIKHDTYVKLGIVNFALNGISIVLLMIILFF